MSDIRLGVIGAGHIASEHLNVIQAMDGINVAGITSRTVSKAEELANNYAIEKVYGNIDSLIEQCAPDAVLILVSADQTFSVTKSVIPFNLPFFVEKPPGLVPEETQILLDLTNKHNIPNMVGYNRRYYSIFHKGLDVIKKHGKLLGIAVEGHERFWKIADTVSDKVRSNWIFGNSTHPIDLLRLFGGDLKNLSAVQKGYIEKNGDQFAAVMEFETGTLGHYIAHWYSPGGWSVRLFGDGVTVEFKPLEKGVWIDMDFKEHEIVPEEVDLKYKPGFYKQMEAFKKMVKTGKLEWPGQNLAASFLTMKLAQKISGD